MRSVSYRLELYSCRPLFPTEGKGREPRKDSSQLHGYCLPSHSPSHPTTDANEDQRHRRRFGNTGDGCVRIGLVRIEGVTVDGEFIKNAAGTIDEADGDVHGSPVTAI